MTVLGLFSLVNFTTTRFLVAGVAGINSHHATIGSVTFAHDVMHLDLQYEFNARQIPPEFCITRMQTQYQLPLPRSSRLGHF